MNFLVTVWPSLQIKVLISYLSLSFIYTSAAAEELPNLLREDEAIAIVAAEQLARFERQREMEEELSEANVVSSRTLLVGDRSLRVNEVEPLKLTKPDSGLERSHPKLTQSELEKLFDEESLLTTETISLGANVYDNAHSEITWRDSETGEHFTVWSNISLNYLRPVSSLRSGEYDYLYFGFVTPITREAEKARIASARALGVKVDSDWKEPPVKFSDTRFEYAVITEDPSAIPAKLYRQMDALLAYYEAHHDSLEIAWKNAQTLQAARAAYLKENPPEPKTTRINFWKIESPAVSR